MTRRVPITPEQLTISDCITGELVVPPRPRPGVCATCRTWTDLGLTLCANCIEVRQHLGVNPVPLDVITLYAKPSALRDILTRYKGRPADVADEDPSSPECAVIVEAMLVRFFREQLESLLADVGPVDALVVVPSTANDPPHPLEDLLAGLDLPLPVKPLLIRGSGMLGFRQPSRDGYTYVGEGAPQRIYLVDDVYTTGARLNSAAYALVSAGHDVVGSLVVARRINPDYHLQARSVWTEQRDATYSWATSPVLSSRTEPLDD